MIREMLKLGYEALKTEAKLVVDKVLDKTAPISPAPQSWDPDAYVEKVIAEGRCIRCAANSVPRTMLCVRCTKVTNG